MKPSALVASLALAVCTPAAAPPPRAPDGPPPATAPQVLAARPGFLECERADGPARPLSEREAYHWMAPAFRASTESIADVTRLIAKLEARVAADPAAEVDGERHATDRVILAMQHLEMSDEYGASACLRERGDRRAELGRLWYLADHHLRAALGHARTAWPRMHLLDVRWQAPLRCARTLAAARLGALDEALAAGAALADEECADTALVWLGDALDRGGRSSEARGVFDRVVARDPGSPFNATCPVAPPTPLTDVQLSRRPEFFRGVCQWGWYARYRLVWLEFRAGTRAGPAVVDALTAIDGEYHPDDQDVAAATLHAAIQRDLTALRAAP